MEPYLVELLSWLEPRAVLVALALPPVIRVVGHWIPEELFMIAMGVLAFRAESPAQAVLILSAVVASHFLADQVVFRLGVWVRPRLQRFPRVSRRLSSVTSRLTASPAALFALVPARVFPLGRGAWLAGCGVVGVPWLRFAAVDLLALLCHLTFWSGMGWWLAGDLGLLQVSAEVGKTGAVWVSITLISTILAVILWRRRMQWSPATVRVVRTAGRTLRRLAR
jgi:membrane protein DedA with SNARE-associated domain